MAEPKAAGDDHRVRTAATDNFTGAQVASDAHQIIVHTAVKRCGCRVTANEQAVGTTVAVNGRRRSRGHTDVISTIDGATTIRRVTAPNRQPRS